MRLVSLTGGIIVLMAHLPLFWSIAKKEVHMNIATWLSWAILDTTTLIVSIVSQVDFPALVIAFTTAAWIVLFLVLRFGIWKWSKLETISVAASLLGLLLWFTLGTTPALIALVTAKYGAAGLPTLKDAFNKPEKKQAVVWSFFALGGLLNMIGAVLSVGAWRISDNLYPTVGTAFNGLTGALHSRKKH